MDKNEVIKKVSIYKQLLIRHLQFERIYLYGSYAKGTNRPDSDIDVAVVVKQIEGDYFSINPLLWKLRRQVDDRIEPLLIESDHDEGDFLGEIKKHGIEIA